MRDAYVEVRKRLLAGQEIPRELEARVGVARATEAAVVRASLDKGVRTATGCAQCHGEPDVKDVRSEKPAARPLAVRPPLVQIFLAHRTALFGAATPRLVGATRAIDEVLTDDQKAALNNFSCCLVPPSSMTDPVRAGQAAGGEKEIELLRYIRGISADRWPIVKVWALGVVNRTMMLVSPGLSAEQSAAARTQAERVAEKARSLSDSEFELEKGKLAQELHGIVAPTGKTSAGQQQYMTAVFLLVPGAGEAYDQLIKRN